jgi:alanyl-tRNA synthetase
MTHRIYYTEPYCRTFDATVTRAFTHDGRPAVTLDRTAFYPTSGGQPFDTGRLGPARVTETIDVSAEPVHVLSEPLASGTAVTGEIDWARRFDHMQQHTGQHLLSAAFARLFDNVTMSFHMGEELSTIDIAREASGDEVERAVDEANRVVWEDRLVAIRFVSADEAQKLALRKEPVRGGTLRLIDIDGFDLSACGGTHVARTGAVGAVAVLGTERVRGGTRVTFACGGRVVRTLRNLRDAVGGSVRMLSVLPQDLPAAIERIQGDSKDLRKTVKLLQEKLAGHEAVRLLAAASEIDGVRVAVEALEGWDAGGLKAVAVSATTAGRAAVALLSSASIVIARSSGVPVDANASLRQLIERFGGRGGGKPDLAQAGGLTGAAHDIASAARELLESAVRQQPRA